MNENQKTCSGHVFGKPFGPNTMLFRIKKRWFCKCYMCNTRKILSATLRCLECKVFVHDRCVSSAAKRETDNVGRGQTAMTGSVQDATAASNAVNGARASEDVATDRRRTVTAEPGSSSVADGNVAEMTAAASAAIGDVRISGLNVHFAVPDDVHRLMVANDSAPAVVLQDDDEIVLVDGVQCSTAADERTEIDVTGTSAAAAADDEIQVSCHADAAGTAVAASEKDAAVVTQDGYQVQRAPIDVKDSIPAVVSQDDRELLSSAPIDVKDSIPAVVSQDDRELPSSAPIDVKDSAPAAALGQHEGQIDVSHSASTDGPIADIDVTCSTSANEAINEEDSVPDVAPQDDEVITTTSY